MPPGSPHRLPPAHRPARRLHTALLTTAPPRALVHSSLPAHLAASCRRFATLPDASREKGEKQRLEAEGEGRWSVEHWSRGRRSVEACGAMESEWRL
ncbi:Os10g0321866 [Oryza sativa Japonica Group]|uniref:Os10g0321866 protein n=1 Tax=Oryza sativa subsp. japonica TaxID=39947 RepID=A0A0P0XT68_ORYSJ|nr:Os10g0321866 [Oryza sativa Japonica Group]